MRVTISRVKPGNETERALQALGHVTIAGVDEAGRGAWAGPVTAGAAILPNSESGLRAIADAGVTDSKRLTAKQRAYCRSIIETHASACATGSASAAEIDQLGIVPATRLAMARAISALQVPADALIIDAVHLPALNLPQRVFNFADSLSLSVACASILAKTARDAWMCELDERLPGYGFARHKGYGVASHAAALDAIGPCVEHRRSFRPIAARLSA